MIQEGETEPAKIIFAMRRMECYNKNRVHDGLDLNVPLKQTNTAPEEIV